jgi:putative ABC transport system ATP-binding protein
MIGLPLTAHDVSVIIDGRSIIANANLTCQPGAVTTLVGPSGSGKTTLLHCLGLLQQPSSGTVLVGESDTRDWRNARRRRFWHDHASFILQDYGIMEDETVAFNVTMKMSLLGRTFIGDSDRVDYALELTGLAGRNNERAAHLSGGEKQRLGIARAIYKNSACLLVDEPTASLDHDNRIQVMSLFARRAAEGCTVVIATHDDILIDASDNQFHILRGQDLVA